ncbi:MAG: AAA family ATPase [Lachnospiraceae bacterium]|nr:AAA family ATPase [Lachnospiraceae bacterium]
MKIGKLFLSDFRGIDKLTLDLQGKSTVLYGINGVGKSTILSAINLLYTPILNKLTRQKIKQTLNIELSDIKYGKASTRIGAAYMFDESDHTLELSRGMTHENKRMIDNVQLDKLVEYYEKLYVGKNSIDESNNLIFENPEYNIPIFVNYGVNRLVLKTPLRFRKKEDYGQIAAFEKAIENQIAFDRLFEWFFDLEFFENMKRKDIPNYQDKELKAVKTAMLAMLDGFEDIHIVARPYSMRVTKAGEILDVLQLSDGEKCTLALFGDIARRLAIANPSLEDPLKGSGVVLIDELELHMHTSWQRKAIPMLIETFPNIQFIITTHSPQVLGEINEDFNVFSLSKEGKQVKIVPTTTMFGMDSNAILEDRMNTDSVSQIIKQKVEEMYVLIDLKDYDGAELIANEIDELTQNRNTDTVRARIIIRRGRHRNA